jgi:hypothetical protein
MTVLISVIRKKTIFQNFIKWVHPIGLMSGTEMLGMKEKIEAKLE